MASTMKARKTTVARQPFWVPSDDNGLGAWRYLPTDEAHNQQVVQYDEETGQRIRQRNVYTAKGWTSAYDLIDSDPNDPRLKLLPDNWRAFSRGTDRRPVFSDATLKALDQHRKAAAA